MVKTRQGRWSREGRSGGPEVAARLDTSEMARILGRRGGLASMAGRTPEQRRALARMGALGRKAAAASRRMEAAQ
jgi:hypothetical protein